MTQQNKNIHLIGSANFHAGSFVPNTICLLTHKYIPISLPCVEHYRIFQTPFHKILLLYHYEYLHVTEMRSFPGIFDSGNMEVT
jgi:hypothetical protein